MTKQELYNQAVNKFDKVQPVNEWQQIGTSRLGVTRYDAQVYKEKEGFQTFTIFVENDGEANEKATIGGRDPLVETPVPVDFSAEVEAFLEGKVVAKQIDGFIPVARMSGTRFAEYYIYRDVSGTLTKETYLLWMNNDNSIGFKKLG